MNAIDLTILEAVFFGFLPDSREKTWLRGVANPILDSDIRVGGDVS